MSKQSRPIYNAQSGSEFEWTDCRAFMKITLMVIKSDMIMENWISIMFSSVQSFSHVRLLVTPWNAACQASLYNSQSLLKLTSIESVMPFNHLILCHPLLHLTSVFLSIRVFSNELFASGGQSIGASASASVLPMNIQDWFLLGLTDLISLQSKGPSRVFSNTIIQKHQFFGAQLSLWSNSHIYKRLLEKTVCRCSM